MRKYNRRVGNLGKSDFLIVHEGIQNYQDIKNQLTDKIIELQEVFENNAHLSDIGLKINFITKDLERISKLCFEKHKNEQTLTLEQFNNLFPIKDDKES